MVVIRRRSRLVTFRVSADEHDALTSACQKYGARSMAEFARVAALQTMQTVHAPTGNLSGDLASLSKELRDLDVILRDMQKRIRGVLGPVSADVSE